MPQANFRDFHWRRRDKSRVFTFLMASRSFKQMVSQSMPTGDSWRVIPDHPASQPLQKQWERAAVRQAHCLLLVSNGWSVTRSLFMQDLLEERAATAYWAAHHMCTVSDWMDRTFKLGYSLYICSLLKYKILQNKFHYRFPLFNHDNLRERLPLCILPGCYETQNVSAFGLPRDGLHVQLAPVLLLASSPHLQ